MVIFMVVVAAVVVIRGRYGAITYIYMHVLRSTHIPPSKKNFSFFLFSFNIFLPTISGLLDIGPSLTQSLYNTTNHIPR